jgi:hypothetical protein
MKNNNLPNTFNSPIFDPLQNCYRVPAITGEVMLIDKDDLWIVYIANWKIEETKHVEVSLNLARVIMGAVMSSPLQVDHINRNPLDNRKINLRFATRSENCANRAKATHFRGKPCRSKFKGVTKLHDKFMAHYKTSETGRITIGMFDSEIEAARAYDKVAPTIFGKFAATNEELGLFDDKPKEFIEPTDCIKYVTRNGDVIYIDNDDQWVVDLGAWACSTKNKTHVGAKIQLPRLIMKPPADMVVDHINNNPLDNRRCNLRVCTQKENMQNTFKHFNNEKPTSSRFKGVCCEKNRMGRVRWTATVRIKDETKRIGRYKSEIVAALVYDYFSNKHYKDFSRTNESMGLFDGLIIDKEHDLAKKAIYNKENGIKTERHGLKQSNASSPYLGVRVDNHQGFTASYMLDRSDKYIGTFRDERIAALTFDLYNLKYNGPNAYTNESKGLIYPLPTDDERKAAQAHMDGIRPDYRTGVKRPKSSSKYRGVRYHKKNENWQAWHSSKGVPKYIGGYQTELQAAKEYDKFVLFLDPQAVTNKMVFPDDFPLDI